MLARQIAIGFGIAVIFPLLVFYGVSTFYPPPKLQNTSTECMFLATTPEQRVECLKTQRAELDAYAQSNKEFSFRFVVIATPLGLLAILVGALLTASEIGTGLIIGGILTIAFGYWGHWQYIDNWVRFVSLLLGFMILLSLGYRGLVGARRRDAGPGRGSRAM